MLVFAQLLSFVNKVLSLKNVSLRFGVLHVTEAAQESAFMHFCLNERHRCKPANEVGDIVFLHEGIPVIQVETHLVSTNNFCVTHATCPKGPFVGVHQVVSLRPKFCVMFVATLTQLILFEKKAMCVAETSTTRVSWIERWDGLFCMFLGHVNTKTPCTHNGMGIHFLAELFARICFQWFVVWGNESCANGHQLVVWFVLAYFT